MKEEDGSQVENLCYRVLSGPEYFDCGPLKARISARQCLLNQGKAKGFRALGPRFMGREAVCLDCPEGRKMVAYPPGVFQPPSPPAEHPSPQPSPARGEGDKDHRQDACATKKPQKLPGWLKNASVAVRRDYLKERWGQESGND